MFNYVFRASNPGPMGFQPFSTLGVFWGGESVVTSIESWGQWRAAEARLAVLTFQRNILRNIMASGYFTVFEE